MSSPNLRLAAAHAVLEVVDRGRKLEIAIAAHTPPSPDPNHRHALFQEMCYGACRYYYYFDAILAKLITKPIAQRDRLVHFILISGCHQLEHMRIPEHAVVSESVEAVKGGRFRWADKMINGVLRNFLRLNESLKQETLPDSARFAFPPWLHREIQTNWSEHCETILQASNCKPPLTLRVNRLRTNRADYLAQLDQHGIEAKPTEHSDYGVTLSTPMSVEKIPGFIDGLASVQDESAQLIVTAFSPNIGSGERVLDGCAAPGGKTGLLLETQPKLAKLVAVDLPDRIHVIQQNLARLGLSAEAKPQSEKAAGTERTSIEVVAGDLTKPTTKSTPQKWWDGQLFDRILLDVPCSGSGVIRRHPDIKHRRKTEDIAKFAEQQGMLLSQSWGLLVNGGTLLYVTCSILPAENDAVIERFIAEQQDAHAEEISELLGMATRFGRQRLPGVHSGDGFYYCLLKKY